MRNNASQKDHKYHPHYTIAPAITTIAIPFLIGRTEKTEILVQPSQEKIETPKPEVTRVERYEISNYILKFLAEKGLFKKRWAVIKEVPINEITRINGSGSELLVTWKGVTDSFVIKNKKASFKGLPEQIQSLIDEQQKNLENAAKADKRKHELAELVDASVCIIDLSFDMLMALQVKPVSWEKLEIYTKSLKDKMCFAQQTLSPLNLDFSKIADAIISQTPEEASRETFNVLNSIYGYFNSLKIEVDLEAAHPNIKDTKAAILASFTLNDLFLGKIVGEKDSQKESQTLETALQNLSKDTNFKLTYQELKVNFDKMNPDAENEGIVDSSREIFKKQLRNISRPKDELSTDQSLAEHAIIPPEPQLIVHQEIQTSPEPQKIVQPQSPEPNVEPLETIQPIIKPTPIDQTSHVLPPKAHDTLQSTKSQMLKVESSPQVINLEQREKIKPKTVEPEVQMQKPTQIEDQIPVNEEARNPSEFLPKKKSAGRRLRKTIMGY
jgi:DNA-binding PadR family transcriptional regulator